MIFSVEEIAMMRSLGKPATALSLSKAVMMLPMGTVRARVSLGRVVVRRQILRLSRVDLCIVGKPLHSRQSNWWNCYVCLF